MPRPTSPRGPLRAASFLLVPLVLGALTGCAKEPQPQGAGGASAGGPGASGAPAASGQGASSAARANSALLAYQQGLALQLKGELALAENEFVRAVELDGGLSEAFFQLGKLRVGLSSRNVGSTARDQETLGKGLDALAQATGLEPNNDEYAYWLGRARHLAKDNAGAREALLRATELNPQNAEAWKRLGMVYLDEADLAKARDAFRSAVAIEPPEAGALFQLGQTLELLDDLDGARSAYERSIVQDRSNPGPHGALAKLLAKQGDDAGAAEAERQHAIWKDFDDKLMRRMVAVNQKPDDAPTLRRLAEMYVAAEKWADAADWCLKAINLDSTDAQAHLYRGMALRHLREFDQALPHLKEAEFLAAEYIDPKLELLRLYGDMEKADEFTELLAAVEAAASADGQSLLDLGKLCRAYGRATDAERLLKKAGDLGVTE